VLYSKKFITIAMLKYLLPRQMFLVKKEDLNPYLI